MKFSKVTALCALLVGAVVPALAVSVNYTTTGSFNGAATTTIATYNDPNGGGGSLTFTGLSSINDTPPVTLDLGMFKVNFTAPGQFLTPNSGDYFTLAISQTTSPSLPGTPVGSDTPDFLTGSMDTKDGVEGSLNVAFNDTSFVIDGISYTLQNVNNGVLSIALFPNTTSVSAELIAVGNFSQTPEPTFWGVLTLGFVGLFMIVSRRKRKQA